MMTPETEILRQKLLEYIERKIKPVAAAKAVVGIGSIASGRAHAESDIDAIVFLEPFDHYVVPAEATWRASDDTHHSIFAGIDGIEVDFLRLDLAQWRASTFDWPEPRRAELAAGWMAYDRTGEVTTLIAERTRYDDDLRIARLDEAVTWLDQHLGEDGPEKRWQTLTPLIAHDRLNAAYTYLVDALFVINRQWRPWRNREMSALLALEWLPTALEDRLLSACIAPSQDKAGYDGRVDALKSLFADVLARLQSEGVYGDDPISDAFIRANEEPGRAWNMQDWQAEHIRRFGENTG